MLVPPDTEQAIITELIKVCPSYKPPQDYRPERKELRLRIPQARGVRSCSGRTPAAVAQRA